MISKIIVPGRPVPQGSPQVFRSKDRVYVTHQKRGDLGLYRESIGRAVDTVVEVPTRWPVTLSVTFYFVRPKGHYGKKGLLPSAPLLMITKPDIDKLLRAVLDGLTGHLYVDDAQVAALTSAKDYADDGRERTEIIWRAVENGH